MGPKFVLKVAVLVAAALVIAGCAGGKAKSQDYQGEFRQFEIYLKPLSVRTASPTSTVVTGGWELYPGANVDVWGFTLDSTQPPTIPGPTIRVKQGDTVNVTFLSPSDIMAHTIHWHGIHVPWNMDGVPYVSQLPIGDSNFDGHGTIFYYEFTADEAGTYWYHCHVDTAHHMDMGMYGALIVDPADPKDDPPYQREAVLLLDEWDKSHSHQNQAALTSALSKSGDPRVTANDMYAFIRDYLLMNKVYDDTVAEKTLKNQPGVRETRDWYPITYAPYFAEYDTFLINGKAFPSTEPVFVKTGETLRIRLINAGENVHAMHLHGHHMFITHKDGYQVPLVYQLGDKVSEIDSEEEMRRYAQGVDTVLIGPGERYDLYVYADNPGPWHLHDHISLNEQNDFINPGGMMTMLCYEDGWPNAQKCKDGHDHGLQGEAYTSGDIVMQMDEHLRKLAGALPVGSTNSNLYPAGTTSGPIPSVTGVPASSSAAAPSSSGLPLPSVPAQHIH